MCASDDDVIIPGEGEDESIDVTEIAKNFSAELLLLRNLRSSEAGKLASKIAKNGEIRQHLMSFQREFSKRILKGSSRRYLPKRVLKVSTQREFSPCNKILLRLSAKHNISRAGNFISLSATGSTSGSNHFPYVIKVLSDHIHMFFNKKKKGKLGKTKLYF